MATLKFGVNQSTKFKKSNIHNHTKIYYKDEKPQLIKLLTKNSATLKIQIESSNKTLNMSNPSS